MKRLEDRTVVIAVVLSVCIGIGLLGCSGNVQVDVEAPETEAADAPDAATEESAAAEADESQATEPAPAASQPAPAPKKPAPPATPPAPPAPRYAIVTTLVPTGSFVSVAFESELSSETSMVGDPFAVRVTQDVVIGEVTAIPAGSLVHGTVTDAVPTKRIGGQASLTLTFERVDLPDGTSLPLVATMVSAGKKQTAKDAGTIAGSTAGGALLGRILKKKDKDKGTAIGAAVGAAVGTAIAAKNEGDPVTIEPGAMVEIQIEQPIEIEREVRVD